MDKEVDEVCLRAIFKLLRQKLGYIHQSASPSTLSAIANASYVGLDWYKRNNIRCHIAMVPE
jgi:hypothetical protein